MKNSCKIKIRYNNRLIHQSEHPLYSTWRNMIDRTNNPKHKDYKINKLRQVNVCNRWLNSFKYFIADMGDRPTYFHYLKRKNNYKDYCLDNCYWAERSNKPKDIVIDNGNDIIIPKLF